ncbi:hypothetical protein BLNAU_976 [Blattamonas nauphoetae]|uniref:Uncharacterized protein n=1 Tax=Blattamonas nauphoetae TaxID=2049346 RepID=A0ABQ9YJG2_9EUKA|nr:hypothetical protein BLNAU_976 [Blattamonas nauphoetae]
MEDSQNEKTQTVVSREVLKEMEEIFAMKEEFTKMLRAIREEDEAYFEWEDEEVEELKTKMGQAPTDIKMYPDAISRRPLNRDYLGNLNRSLYSLETESFHLFKLGTSALTNSSSTEDLARGVELMTLESSELVNRVNDTRIEYILKIPVDGVGSAAKMESLTKQNERIDAAMVEAQEVRTTNGRGRHTNPGLLGHKHHPGRHTNHFFGKGISSIGRSARRRGQRTWHEGREYWMC